MSSTTPHGEPASAEGNGERTTDNFFSSFVSKGHSIDLSHGAKSFFHSNHKHGLPSNFKEMNEALLNFDTVSIDNLEALNVALGSVSREIRRESNNWSFNQARKKTVVADLQEKQKRIRKTLESRIADIDGIFNSLIDELRSEQPKVAEYSFDITAFRCQRETSPILKSRATSTLRAEQSNKSNPFKRKLLGAQSLDRTHRNENFDQNCSPSP
ncbi:unnamed protein product [Caenorhabditis auriculariae]|uniref:Uncharacterized protein n=1 Tax=Caenorhabditis auriculariae TaxID=2777116 RepID=A0A8S1HMZ0_9PELO|nr:unnamed protein product [Caenorhabditis auriculariae]